MKKVSIQDKASLLRNTIGDLVDAVVDEKHAMHKASRTLPAEVVAALSTLVAYLRAEHVECPKCGETEREVVVTETGTCLACWHKARAISGAKA